MRRFPPLLAALVGLALAVGPAFAHDWYPLACCSDQDCREIPREAVTVTADGWRVPSGEVIGWGDDRLRRTPPEREGVHWCTVGGRPDGRTLCLFVEPQGS
jgi:hypothetical protein